MSNIWFAAIFLYWFYMIDLDIKDKIYKYIEKVPWKVV